MSTDDSTSDLTNALLQARIVERVITEVARVYGLEARQVTGRGRTEPLLEARTMALFLCARHSDATHAQIAQRFMGRSPGAVACAERAYHRHWTADRDGFRSKAFVVGRRIYEAFG